MSNPYHSSPSTSLSGAEIFGLSLANLQMLSSKSSEPEDVDIDVVGLSETTRDVSLNDRNVDDSKPLDLTYKSEVPTTSRLSVIVDNHENKDNTTKHLSIRRSVSSVTSSSSTHENVVAHFRRSLSGKWPKSKNIEESRNSPLRRRMSFNNNNHHQQSSISRTTSTEINKPNTIIVTNYSDTSMSIADHFRRALNGKKLEKK